MMVPFDLYFWSGLKTVINSPLLAFHSLIEHYGHVVRISIAGQDAILLGGIIN
jgi:hypothetical protein